MFILPPLELNILHELKQSQPFSTLMDHSIKNIPWKEYFRPSRRSTDTYWWYCNQDKTDQGNTLKVLIKRNKHKGNFFNKKNLQVYKIKTSYSHSYKSYGVVFLKQNTSLFKYINDIYMTNIWILWYTSQTILLTLYICSTLSITNSKRHFS